MSDKPNPSDFQNVVAYHVADILWRNGGLADALTPEELHWLQEAPKQIEGLQRQLLRAIESIARPIIILDPNAPPVEKS